MQSLFPIVILGLLASALVGATVPETQPVDVFNGSFEIAHPSKPESPDGWSATGGEPARCDATVAHEGGKSLRLHSTGSRQEVMTNTTFPIEDRMTVELRVWSRADQARGHARVYLFWFDPSVHEVGSQAFELPTGTHGWMESRFSVKSPPKAGRIGLHCLLEGSGTLWIDDIQVNQMTRRTASKPTTKAVYMSVDISKQANMAFADNRDGDGVGGWTDQGDNDLGNFPRGRQVFAGVPFDILDLQSHGDKAAVMLGSARKFPNEITISPVPRRFDVLHILHAAAWINNGKVGEYILRYTDGTEAKTDVIADVHLADWWYPVNLPGATVAWFGSNRIRDLVGVWLMSWVNPHPEKDVFAIVLRSTRVVLGICGMTTQEGGPLPTDRKAPTIQVTLTPESLCVSQGQPIRAKAVIYHGQNEPLKVHSELALYRGGRSDAPIKPHMQDIVLNPKQPHSIEFVIDKADLPYGSYRLVCTARGPDDSAETSIPVSVMPGTFQGADLTAKKFYGFGMMYGGPGIVEDFRRIKEGGFDWVAPDLHWKDLEPQPGVYNWTTIDQYVQTAKAVGVKLGIKTLLFLGNPWFDKTQLQKDGITPSNFSDEFAERYSALWRAIMDRYKDEPTIFAWCPTIGCQDNPVGYLDSDATPAIKSAWRNMLRSNGWTLEKVSAALGKTVSTWDEIDPPTASYANAHGSNDYFRLFLKMRREQAVAVYSRLCDVIRAKDPRRPIMLKMGQPWPLDVYDAPSGLWPSGWMRMCRTYHAQLIHSNFEDTVAAAILPSMAELYGVKMMIEEGKTPPTPPTTLGAVGHGARYDTLGMEYCVWPMGKRLTDWTRLKPAAFRLLEFDRVYDNLWVTSLQDNLFATGESWPKLVRYYVKFYDLLTKAGYQYQVTDSENIPRTPRDTVLLDANCTRLDDLDRKRIDEYVKNGGTFVGQFLTDSEAAYALYAQWGIRLRPHAAGRVALAGTNLSCLAADGFVPEGNDLRPLARWEDRQAAAVIKKIGAGRVVIIGCGFESDVASSAALLQALLEKFGVRRHVKIHPYGAVEVSVKRRSQEYQVSLMNRAPTAQEVTVSLPEISPTGKVHDWLNGKDLNWTQGDLKVTVEPCEIRPLEFTSRPANSSHPIR